MSNMTVENGPEPDLRNTAYAVVFGSVTALGFPLNAVSLWILLCCHSHRSPSTVFMIHLAISDLLLAFSLPLRVYFHATGSWPFGFMTCISITMLFRNNIRSSSIFITFISVDRLLAVVYPLRSRHLRTSSNAWKAAVLAWVLVFGLNVPESVEFSRFYSNKSRCFEVEDHPRSGMSCVQPVLVLAMLAVNVVSTVLVSRTLRRHLNDSARVFNKVNVMLIFAMNLIMFIVFFLPVSLFILFKKPGPALTPLLCLSSVNCCLDPLLYYFAFDGFWKRKEDADSSGGRE
ncbi:lysophosphatidic acid receptor 6-like [Pseudochaenichthys georgianus]|uniref:lysophosphatidic acid receptor 6-like n=1 Tax=Pseudochaenichthys georgianus TaxID=52239 RepID=UPI00146C0540|nr:lysophosphatidic acid receptor 6-like [Pseudochaenichthys georgianus]